MAEAPTGVAQHTGSDKAGIRPFQISFPEAALTDLRKRINATKWPEPETVKDASQGVQFATMQKLARYWGNEYDWSKCEARLKAVPHFITEIDGLDIHFIHVRSKHENALPLIVTHGWPGSFIEQMKIIDPLTNPTAHGGTASDAFHVVIPSLPGYGFSGKPTTTNDWDPPHIASAWAVLMKRLEYTKYVAQGAIGGTPSPRSWRFRSRRGCSASPPTWRRPFPPRLARQWRQAVRLSSLSADERRAWDQLIFFYTKGLAYANEMGLRPQTLYGIADSPVGLAAWILDHDAASYELIVRVFDGKPEGLTRDDILDNITLYWLTNTAISSARLYWTTASRSKGAVSSTPRRSTPGDRERLSKRNLHGPEELVGARLPKLLLYSKHEKGSHFAAWEQPAAIVADLRTRGSRRFVDQLSARTEESTMSMDAGRSRPRPC